MKNPPFAPPTSSNHYPSHLSKMDTEKRGFTQLDNSMRTVFNSERASPPSPGGAKRGVGPPMPPAGGGGGRVPPPPPQGGRPAPAIPNRPGGGPPPQPGKGGLPTPLIPS